MDFKITEEKVLEVAKRYGLSAKKSDTPGFFIKGEKIEVDELYEKMFDDFGFEEEVLIPKSMEENITVEKSNKLNYKHLINDFSDEVSGAA